MNKLCPIESAHVCVRERELKRGAPTVYSRGLYFGHSTQSQVRGKTLMKFRPFEAANHQGLHLLKLLGAYLGS